MVLARSESGCLACHLSTDLGEKSGIRYVEEWKDERDLQRQLRSGRFAKIAELVERSTERPTIEFSLSNGIRGIEYAEEVRRTLEN
jgi:quinol monooxygenase YgiN